MLDRELIRQSPEVIRDSLTKRGEDVKLLDEYIELDRRWREELSALEPLRAEKNKASREGKPDSKALKKAKDLADKIAVIEKKVKKTEAGLRQALLSLPNIVLSDVPVGPGDSANTVVKQV